MIFGCKVLKHTDIAVFGLSLFHYFLKVKQAHTYIKNSEI